MMDNYDLWSEHDAKLEADLEKLPECSSAETRFRTTIVMKSMMNLYAKAVWI